MKITLIAIVLLISSQAAVASGLPVVSTHPRIMLTPAVKSALVARKNANDPKWLRVRDRADELVGYSILQYKWASRSDAPENSIYYTYQGEGWFAAAMPLAMAYQMTGDTKYSNKLFALVDEMQRAQTDPDNMPPNGFGPLVPDNYYSTRSLCPVLAIAYDWCYDQLTPARKASIIALMNLYYNELRDSAYQRNDHADGNYYVGHLFGTAWMGYASHGDNPTAQTMIDWARIRFDGTTSATIDAEHTPEDFFAQLFEGGTRPQPAREYNGPTISGAPHKGGIHLQGWAYGTATYNWIIDYLLTVKSATTEDLFVARGSWFSQMLRALKSGLLPNRFEMDNTGDYGGNYGAVMFRSLPVRLAYTLAGTADGPGAQNFAYNEIAKTSPYPIEFPDDIYQMVYQPTEWEDFFFSDPTRPAEELKLPPYYSGFEPVYPQGGATNGAMPFFYMRNNWSESATWASVHQGAAWYDDHQHADAGTFQIKHGNDYLLIDATNWKGETGSIGIVGSSQNAQYNAGAAANTLFFDDYAVYLFDPQADSRFCGGQGLYGRDIVTAAEQLTSHTYIRADHSTAYTNTADTTDTTPSTLEYFYRSFVYLPPVNIFVVYDQTKNRASTHARGEYRKHMRWHFPNQPTVTGSALSMQQGSSRLNMSFLLPTSAAVVAVDENNNPDPCAPNDPNCVPYAFNSGTWRVEVSDPAMSRTTPFLAVLQPAALADQTMTTSLITATGGGMVGTKVIQSGQGTYVVMFNTAEGASPVPILNVQYSVPGASGARHVLTGLKPETKYAANVTGDNVSVVEDANGQSTSSKAGVLQFGTAVVGVEQTNEDLSQQPMLVANYPNPFSGSTTFSVHLAKRQHINLTVYDAMGRSAISVVDAVLDAGDHNFTLNASELSSGVYNCCLRTEGISETRQCTVVK